MVFASVSSRCTLRRRRQRLRAASRCWRAAACAASAARSALRFGECRLGGGKRAGQRRQVGLAAAGRGQAGFDVGELGFQSFRALPVFAHGACS